MISVVIPAHDGARFLDSALRSVARQAEPDLEILVVDDGSRDDLVERCPPEVRTLRQPRRGPAAARNRGIRESKGELLAFLDVDDQWTDGHLERLRAALARAPEAGIAQGRMRQFAEGPEGRRGHSGAYRMPYLGSCLFRRWVFEVCGLFDESLELGEDYDLLFRCWERDVPKRDVEEVSLLYRRHPGNTTRGRYARSHLLVLKRRMERIRTGRVDPREPRRVPFDAYIGETGGADEWIVS